MHTYLWNCWVIRYTDVQLWWILTNSFPKRLCQVTAVVLSGLSMGSDMAFPGRALGGSCSPRTRRGAQTVRRGLWGGVSHSRRLRPPGQPDSLVCVCILSLGAPCGDVLVGALPQAFLRETSLLRGLAETLSACGLGTSPVPSLIPPLCTWVLCKADAFGLGLLRGEMHLSVLRSWQLVSVCWRALAQ